jgi:hypothetical protein
VGKASVNVRHGVDGRRDDTVVDTTGDAQGTIERCLSVLASLLLGGTGTPESGALLEIVLPKGPVLWALGAEVVGRTTSSALLGLDAVV